MADAQKGSHLDMKFSTPVEVEVPAKKVRIQVHEMLISLPLLTGGIWVRTDDRVMYFAMFDRTASEAVQKMLDKAQKP